MKLTIIGNNGGGSTKMIMHQVIEKVARSRAMKLHDGEEYVIVLAFPLASRRRFHLETHLEVTERE